MTVRLFFLPVIALFLLPLPAISQEVDTALIEDLKQYFYRETGYIVQGNPYTQWDYGDAHLRFISPADRIDEPEEEKAYTVTADFDTIEEQTDYDTLFYDIPANAACLIKPEFANYESEGLAFLVFHELMHNFIRQRHIDLLYAFEEAICDVSGNYFTLNFARTDPRIRTEAAQQQIVTNDSLYAIINRCISEIADHPDQVEAEQARCEEGIKRVLLNGNTFQRFRFGYEVNNGFLLKCRNYSWNYFIMKRIFLEQSTAAAFTRIIGELPVYYSQRSDSSEQYFQELIAHTEWTLDVTFDWNGLSPVFPDNIGYFVITNRDPLNRFISLVNHSSDSVTVSPEMCQSYWNEMIRLTRPLREIGTGEHHLNGTYNFGRNWLVTAAFVSEGQLLCWMEELDLQMGKKSILKLSVENVTLISTQRE